MGDRAGRARLAHEPARAIRVAGRAVAHDLQREHLAVVPPHPEDASHPALTSQGLDLVRPEGPARDGTGPGIGRERGHPTGG